MPGKVAGAPHPDLYDGLSAPLGRSWGPLAGTSAMPSNHLEDLTAEWYGFRGYFVQRNIQVGKRAKGGYECELDIVALHPQNGHLIHIEPSMDTDSWARREVRYQRKFGAGRKYIPKLFEGFRLPNEIEQIALLTYGSAKNHSELAGGRIVMIQDLMTEILTSLNARPVASAAVPETYPLLRTLQFAAEWWPIEVPRAG
jgi:hypothetical protein